MASAYLFSSDTSLVDLDAASFSIAFWLRPTTGPSFTAVTLVEGPAFKLVLNSDGTITFTINNSPTATESSISTGASVAGSDWNHVVIVYDKTAGTITVYLNGSVNSTSYTQPADSSVSQYVPDFQFGDASRVGDPTSTNFDIDSATVWARALLSIEVEGLFNSGTGLDYPFLGGPFSLIFQANILNDPATPLILGTGFQLWEADRSYDGSTGLFRATLNLLYSGTQTSLGFAWVATNFFDKVIVAQHDNPVQYWQPPFPTLSRDLPGLPTNDDQWDGVNAFFGHVLLWKNDRIKWSDKDDFSLFIPVSQTAVSAILNIETAFTQPAIGGTVTVTVENTTAQVVSISLSGVLDFGSIAVGTTSQILMTILNTGTTDLTVTGISITDGFPATTDGVFPQTIPVNGSIPIVVTFAPTVPGDFNGAITVASNATVGTPSLPMSGTGTGSIGVISLSGNLAFGNVRTGQSISSALVITNTGTATLNVTGITLPAGFTGSFSGTVAAGASHDVAVTFHPTAVISYSGTASVASDASSGTGIFPVSGAGVGAGRNNIIFLTDNGTCQFGPVATGGSATGTLRIYNNGANTMHVVGLTLPTGFSGSFTGSIAAHGFHDVTITFNPVDPILYSGVITVATSVVMSGSNSVLVTGTGKASGKVISLSGSLDFGDVPVGSSVQNILTISNVGDTDLTVSSITYPTGFSGTFAGVIVAGKSKNILVTFQPTAAIAYSGNITVNSDKTSGTNTIAVSGMGTALPIPTTLTPGQFVTIADVQGGITYYNYYTVISMTGTSLVLQLLDLTGPTPPGATIIAGEQVVTVDANESGEAQVVGSQTNGPIFNILILGEYAFIFKERSISSMQYVGITSGTFFIRPEVIGEGLIARQAVIELNDGRFVFLGHKELYQYAGGATPTPVCQQFTRQLYRELDRTRLEQILLFHNEIKNEIWVQYPTIGGSAKVLIWNYTEDTAAIDIYDPLITFTAINFADWTTDPTWDQLPDSTLWSTFDASIIWQALVGASQDHATIFGSLDGNLRIHGLSFAREGQGYLSLSETMDFDLGECDAWKYVDVVVIGLQVRSPETQSRIMYIQVGASATLNGSIDEIVWSDPFPVLVNGQAPSPVKVNPGGAGRYLRLRFYSQDAGVEWRVSSFEIHSRPGGWY